MLTLRKTYNTTTARYFYFSNGYPISKEKYDTLNNYGARNMRTSEFRTFRHGQWYLEGAPLISTVSVYCSF
jgi:hypothetical protein